MSLYEKVSGSSTPVAYFANDISKLESELSAIRAERDALQSWKDEVEKAESVGEVGAIQERGGIRNAYCLMTLGDLPMGTKLYLHPAPAKGE